MPVTQVKAEATTEAKEPKRKTLKDLFHESCAIAVDRTLMHQAFQIPGASMESTLSAQRLRKSNFKMVYHPGYGLIGQIEGKYFLSPSANVVVAHE